MTYRQVTDREKEIIEYLGEIEIYNIKKSLQDSVFGVVLETSKGFYFKYVLFAGTLFIDGDFGVIGLSFGYTHNSAYNVLSEALENSNYQYLYSKIKTMRNMSSENFKRRNKVFVDYYLVGLKLALNKLKDEVENGK